jgi:tetratricopeptide (TPR) repeat protein
MTIGSGKGKMNRDKLTELARFQEGDLWVPVDNKIYKSIEWKRLKKEYLKNNPICESCLSDGKKAKSKLVHHIIPLRKGGAFLEEDNLIALCKECHYEIHSLSVSIDGNFPNPISFGNASPKLRTILLDVQDEALTNISTGDQVFLRRLIGKAVNAFETDYLIEVTDKSGVVLGFLDDYFSHNSYLTYDMDHGLKVDAYIDKIHNNNDRVEIRIHRDEINWGKAKIFDDKYNQSKEWRKKAISLEEKNPEQAVKFYRKYMQSLLDFDKFCRQNGVTVWRHHELPIKKILILLEKLCKYEEALSEIEQYNQLNDEIGLSKSSLETIEKKVRIIKKTSKG